MKVLVPAYVLACVALLLVPVGWIEPVRLGVLIFAAAASLTFSVQFHRRTGGHWRDSIHGVHVMTFNTAILVILLSIIPAYLGWISQQVFFFVLTWIYLTVGFLAVWRLLILRRDQREPIDPSSSDRPAP